MIATVDLKVVDASALAAFLFQESQARAVAEKLQDARLITPFLLDYELVNVCLNKLRRDPARREVLLVGFRARNRVTIERAHVDPDAVLALAEATGLTAYDASYLWLARDRRAELVTLDKRLEAAFVQTR